MPIKSHVLSYLEGGGGLRKQSTMMNHPALLLAAPSDWWRNEFDVKRHRSDGGRDWDEAARCLCSLLAHSFGTPPKLSTFNNASQHIGSEYVRIPLGYRFYRLVVGARVPKKIQLLVVCDTFCVKTKLRRCVYRAMRWRTSSTLMYGSRDSRIRWRRRHGRRKTRQK